MLHSFLHGLMNVHQGMGFAATFLLLRLETWSSFLMPFQSGFLCSHTCWFLVCPRCKEYQSVNNITKQPPNEHAEVAGINVKRVEKFGNQTEHKLHHFTFAKWWQGVFCSEHILKRFYLFSFAETRITKRGKSCFKWRQKRRAHPRNKVLKLFWTFFFSEEITKQINANHFKRQHIVWNQSMTYTSGNFQKRQKNDFAPLVCFLSHTHKKTFLLAQSRLARIPKW